MKQVATVNQSPAPQHEQIAFSTMRASVRDRFHSWEFWLVVFDKVSEPAIDEIVKRHYRNCAEGDFSIFTVEMPGQPYGIGLFRKLLMPARKLRKILRRCSPLTPSERDLHGQDVLVLVQVWNLPVATSLIAHILQDDSPAPMQPWLN